MSRVLRKKETHLAVTLFHLRVVAIVLMGILIDSWIQIIALFKLLNDRMLPVAVCKLFLLTLRR